MNVILLDRAGTLVRAGEIPTGEIIPDVVFWHARTFRWYGTEGRAHVYHEATSFQLTDPEDGPR
jgi:hypothetical protein